MSLIWLPLTSIPFHSLLWDYHIRFMPTFWGMQLGHKTRPGHSNMQHWRFGNDWSCMCVSWSLSYSTSFQSDLLPPIFRTCAPCIQVPCIPECPWEHKALAWVGYNLWRWGNNLPCGVYYSEFLDFFSSLGRTVSESWMALQWVGYVPDVWT